MAIKFQCTSCESDFDMEIPRIIDRPTALKCPKCNAKPPAHRAESLGTALEDLLAAMSAIRSQVRFQIKLDTEELPPPYGPSNDDNALGGADDDDLAEGMDDEDEEEESDKDSDDEDDDEDSDDDDDEESDEDGDEDESSGDDDDGDAGDDDDDDDDDEDEDEDDDD